MSTTVPLLKSGLEVGRYAIPALPWTGKNHTVTIFFRENYHTGMPARNLIS